VYTEVYLRRGLDREALDRLDRFGDLLLNAGFNVTSIREPQAIEEFHFLDCLSLLDVAEVRSARRLVDLGSGGGLPALILALALPETRITAVESLNKKCVFIQQAAAAMDLDNVDVRCARAEEYGRGSGRGVHDVAVSRALAALAVVAEYSLPLLEQGGVMIAMKGDISIEERIHCQKALDILGGGELGSSRLEPFPGAENRWVYVSRKVRATPASYPRRPGLAKQRPLGR
jgi:16S rRNA (guanine527-N7)-methyltransferase